ncbi:hypothetical protein Taro_053472 [Colocasia esculenta]|uniref:Uncharacterized protein n=1 Tax=Colocasia esculenta TaxID=4460 RepID=A0A843XMP3_COLES|nr:hypothetical protein [Colocasia esculenta]
MCIFVGDPRLRIPLVCLPADVATARRVATSEEASAPSGATLSVPATLADEGLRMRRGDEDEMAIMPRSIMSKEVLESFMGSGRAAQNVQAGKGINLQKLAAWTMKEIPKVEDDANLEKVMKGFAICLAGALLFPSMDNMLEEEQLSAVCGIWEGERLGPAVLAFLYSGLMAASLGMPPYESMLLFTCWSDLHFKFNVNNEATSSSKIFFKSPFRHMDGLVGLQGCVENHVPQLKMRTDWRDHLRNMPRNAFSCTPGPLLAKDLWT